MLYAPKEFNIMKKGAGIVNAARGGVIDEVALLKLLKKVKFPTLPWMFLKMNQHRKSSY